MVALAKSRGEIGGEEISVEERTRIAMQMWKKEKVFAIFVLLACWIVKVSSSAVTKGKMGGRERVVELSLRLADLLSLPFHSSSTQLTSFSGLLHPPPLLLRLPSPSKHLPSPPSHHRNSQHSLLSLSPKRELSSRVEQERVWLNQQQGGNRGRGAVQLG